MSNHRSKSARSRLRTDTPFRVRVGAGAAIHGKNPQSSSGIIETLILVAIVCGVAWAIVYTFNGQFGHLFK